MVLDIRSASLPSSGGLVRIFLGTLFCGFAMVIMYVFLGAGKKDKNILFFLWGSLKDIANLRMDLKVLNISAHCQSSILFVLFADTYFIDSGMF